MLGSFCPEITKLSECVNAVFPLLSQTISFYIHLGFQISNVSLKCEHFTYYLCNSMQCLIYNISETSYFECMICSNVSLNDLSIYRNVCVESEVFVKNLAHIPHEQQSLKYNVFLAKVLFQTCLMVVVLEHAVKRHG